MISKRKSFLATLLIILVICVVAMLIPAIPPIASAESADNSGEYIGFANGANICETLQSSNAITEKPVFTILTPGQGANVSRWSDNGAGFSYDPSSIIEKLRNNYKNSKVYVIRKEFKVETGTKAQLFPLDIKNGKYINFKEEKLENEFCLKKLTDCNAHSIILFESTSNNELDHHSNVYDDFEWFVDNLAYDYYYQTGQVPKINLIGHSRGGIINMMYAKDHPKMIDSIFSMGTPYLGSNLGSLIQAFKIPVPAVDSLSGGDILNPELQDDLKTGWKNALMQNPYMRLYTLGGTTDSSLLKILLEEFRVRSEASNGEFSEVESFVHYLLSILVKAVDKTPILSNLFLDTVSLITFIGDRLIDIYDQHGEDVITNITALVNSFKLNTSAEKWYEYLDLTNYSTLMEDDFTVDLSSQLAEGYGSHYTFIKEFNDRTADISRKSNPGSYSIPHNLEARDYSMINYILDNIDMGQTESPYRIERLSDGTAMIAGIRSRGNGIGKLISIPEEIDGLKVTKLANYIFAQGYNGKDFGEVDKVVIPASIKSIGKNVFAGTKIKEFEVAADNTNYCSIDGNLYTKDGTILLQYAVDNARTNYVLPSGTERISDFAFFGAAKLKGVNLADVNVIGNCSFKMSGLETITAPADTVFEIGNNVFDDTPLITNSTTEFLRLNNVLLKFNGSGSIGAEAFPAGIDTISSGAFAGSGITSVDLPWGIKNVASEAFFGCADLTSARLGEQINYLGRNAFSNCPSLDKVHIDFTYSDGVEPNCFNYCGEDFKLAVKYLYLEQFKTADNLKYYDVNIVNETVSIAFDTQGGNELTAITVPYYSNLADLPVPEKANYTFTGWYDEAQGGTRYDNGNLWSIYGNGILYARWTPVEYSITYNLYDGATEIEFYNVEEEAILMTGNSRTGYSFGGWFDNVEFTGVATEKLSVGSFGNKVLYAKWIPNAYSVTLDKNAASATLGQNSATVHYQQLNNLPVPTREHYNFDGWFTVDGDNNQVFYTDGEGNGVKVWDMLSGATLKAKWSVAGYVIKINPQTGTVLWVGSNGNLSEQLPSDEQFIAPGATINFDSLNATFKGHPSAYKQGLRFIGFTKPSTGPTLRSSEIISAVDPTTLFSGPKNTNDIAETEEYIIELIPHWEMETHTLVFSYPTSNNETISLEYFSSITNALSDQQEKAEANAPTGHTFGYWYWMNNGTEIRFSEITMPDLTLLAANETDPAKILAAQENGSRVLYAKFTPKTYKIFFVSNWGETFDPISITYGSVITNLPALSRVGCISGDWYCGDSIVSDGATYNYAQNIILLARWQYITYSISYNLNGGENGIGNPVNYNVDSNTIVLNEPKKFGFKFTGWEVNGVKKSDIPRGSTGNLTFNATWHGVVVDYIEVPEIFIEQDYTIMNIKGNSKLTFFTFGPDVSHFTLIGNGEFIDNKFFLIENQRNFTFNIQNARIGAVHLKNVIYSTGNLILNAKGDNYLGCGVTYACDIADGVYGTSVIHCENLKISGDKLTIKGGNGEFANHSGNDGIDAADITCDISELYVEGGNGKKADNTKDGQDYGQFPAPSKPKKGKPAQNGTNGRDAFDARDGGNGGDAIVCNSITISSNSKVVVVGGNGASGGDGGNGGGGSPGGPGGDGAFLIKSQPGGNGGNGGDGGNGGNGGDAGYGVYCIGGRITGNIDITNGQAGAGGKGGAGGQGGKCWDGGKYKGQYQASGANGTDGANGIDGRPGASCQ